MRPLIVCAALLASTVAAADAPADVRAANTRLGRGINLGNALEAPHEGDWGVTLKAAYFKAIADAGFRTVRLPVRWSAHAKAEPPYTIDPKFFESIDWCVDQATANNLSIIVNAHHYDEVYADPDRHLPRLAGLWEQIAARYKDRPAGVYFELLNEPNGKLAGARWNAAIPELLRPVRKTNPTRPVVVGPGEWNAIRALDKLELPAGDRHLILTVHFYDPYQFTHQGAPWAKGSDKWKGTKWTGSDAEKEAIRKSFDRAAAWAKERDRAVFLGEFGAYQEADAESRARWTRFVAREAEARGFSWAYGEFCAGFGAFDPKAERWRDPLKAALLDR